MTTTWTTDLNGVATISFTWQQLEALLEGLAESEAQASMIPHLVSGLAKQYLFLDETLLLSEIMRMAVCVADSQFKASPGSGHSAREPGWSSSP